MLNEEALVDKYGEVCTKKKAAHILGRSANTINAMLRDGRLDHACAGTMVDVRSIARYIASPKLEDHKARIQRLKQRTGSQWAV